MMADPRDREENEIAGVGYLLLSLVGTAVLATGLSMLSGDYKSSMGNANPNYFPTGPKIQINVNGPDYKLPKVETPEGKKGE